MAGVDPVTAIADAVKEISALLAILFNGENRQILANVKDIKRRLAALDIAEEIFQITDPKFIDDKEYKKLRKKFDAKD